MKGKLRNRRSRERRWMASRAWLDWMVSETDLRASRFAILCQIDLS
jgi:hypothetical protein